MKYSAVIVAALATVASAQDISIFPACSLPCIMDAISTATNCQATDYACVCSNMDALTSAATGCVVDKCGIDVATGQVLPATKQLCASVSSSSSSADVTVTSSTTESETMSTSTSTLTSAESSTSDMVTTTESATTTVAVVPVTTTTKKSGNGTATRTVSPTPTSVFTAGAAVMGSVGSAAILLLGAAAFAF